MWISLKNVIQRKFLMRLRWFEENDCFSEMLMTNAKMIFIKRKLYKIASIFNPTVVIDEFVQWCRSVLWYIWNRHRISHMLNYLNEIASFYIDFSHKVVLLGVRCEIFYIAYYVTYQNHHNNNNNTDSVVCIL